MAIKKEKKAIKIITLIAQKNTVISSPKAVIPNQKNNNLSKNKFIITILVYPI